MKFYPLYFFLALFLGLTIVYFFLSKPKLTIKYPNLKDLEGTTYMDDKNVCYKYHKIKIDCKE